jgi:hypothetical protein
VVRGVLPLLLIYYRLIPISGWRVIEPPGHPHLPGSFQTTNKKEPFTATFLTHFADEQAIMESVCHTLCWWTSYNGNIFVHLIPAAYMSGETPDYCTIPDFGFRISNPPDRSLCVKTSHLSTAPCVLGATGHARSLWLKRTIFRSAGHARSLWLKRTIFRSAGHPRSLWLKRTIFRSAPKEWSLQPQTTSMTCRA